MSEATGLLDCFVEHAPISPGAIAERTALSEVLRDLCYDARAAWSGFELSDLALVAHIASHIRADDEPMQAVAAVCAADVYLALACARGELEAIAAFERDLMPGVRATVLGMRATVTVADEVSQIVRERLLVGDAERGPRIADYAGRGSLRRWLRAIAGRTYLNQRRKGKREVIVNDEAFLDAVASDQSDPALAHMKDLYRGQFKEAFVSALLQMADRPKTLLRYRYVDELGIDKLAGLYNVHRATLHRWLADAREALALATERELRGRLDIGAAEYHSIRRLVLSQLDLSIHRFLGPTK